MSNSLINMLVFFSYMVNIFRIVDIVFTTTSESIKSKM